MKIPQSFWKKNQIKHLILVSETNRFWLTNFSASFGLVVISHQENKPIVFLDERYKSEGKKNIKDGLVYSLHKFSDYWKKLEGNVGCEADLSWNMVLKLKKGNPQINLKPTFMDELRMIKNPTEIKKIRNICQITKKVWSEIETKITAGWLEKDIEILIYQTFLKHGVSELSFPPIVSSGVHSRFIHTKPKKIAVKNHVLCDFGGKLENYCSDFTRVLILNPKSEIKILWDLVKKLQKQIIAAIHPGITIGSLAQMADDFYRQNKIAQKHSLGHGIGLKVHEAPNIYRDSKLVLKTGMVFTIEPGIYDDKLGGVRIEDIVLVTETGCEVLT